jgi:hypothetical protein
MANRKWISDGKGGYYTNTASGRAFPDESGGLYTDAGRANPNFRDGYDLPSGGTAKRDVLGNLDIRSSGGKSIASPWDALPKWWWMYIIGVFLGAYIDFLIDEHRYPDNQPSVTLSQMQIVDRTKIDVTRDGKIKNSGVTYDAYKYTFRVNTRNNADVKRKIKLCGPHYKDVLVIGHDADCITYTVKPHETVKFTKTMRFPKNSALEHILSTEVDTPIAEIDRRTVDR